LYPDIRSKKNMPKVSVIVVAYNSAKWVSLVFDAIQNQTHKDLEIFAVINESIDGTKELIAKNYPQVKIIDPQKNTGFAGGNNLAIRQSQGEFIQLVNPDLILEPDYIQKLLTAFDDPLVGAATGKLLKFDFANHKRTKIIDSTGVTVSSSGRAKDRGQNQEDRGQFDKDTAVFAVTGAAPMYRISALEKVKFKNEYFDEDFLAYWEDVDLSWRLNSAGFKNIYVPAAVAYHGRTAGQSKGGYAHVLHFIKHHQQLSPFIKKLNYKNHILMYLKNAPYIHPAFILREIAMFGYILLFETATLKVIPELIRLLPRMRAKRRHIKGI
jgi:GT2 family glycosyltransferase